MTVLIDQTLFIAVVDIPQHLVPTEEGNVDFNMMLSNPSLDFNINEDEGTVVFTPDDDSSISFGCDASVSCSSFDELSSSMLLHIEEIAGGFAPSRGSINRNTRRGSGASITLRGRRQPRRSFANGRDSLNLANGRGLRRLEPRVLDDDSVVEEDGEQNTGRSSTATRDSINLAGRRGLRRLEPRVLDEDSVVEGDLEEDDNNSLFERQQQRRQNRQRRSSATRDSINLAGGRGLRRLDLSQFMTDSDDDDTVNFGDDFELELDFDIKLNDAVEEYEEFSIPLKRDSVSSRRPSYQSLPLN